MRRRSLLILSSFLLLLAGCGGGGSSNNNGGGGTTPPPGPVDPKTAQVKLDIDWGARSRAVSGPSSALSALVTLQGAGANGNDFSFTVNRNTNLAAHRETYTSAQVATVGVTTLTVRFFALANATGAQVGLAQASATLREDGTLSTVISTQQAVQSVVITAGQTVKVGETKNLVVTARASGGATVAVGTGAIFVEVVTGQDKLTTSGPQITGVRPGAAFVRASVDGITSPEAVVNVTSDATVAITARPTGPINSGATFDFNAVVSGVPAGSSNAVTWSIAEGAAGGTIDANGVYTAPAAWTPQTNQTTFTIVATSVFDPSKTATFTVTVRQFSGVTLNPQTATISVNETQQFTATIAGGTGVIWTVEEGPTGGTVNQAGLYTAPSTPGVYHVIARSVSNTTVFARATITVQAGNGTVIIN